MSKSFDDDDRMPFGKYRGERMADVPDSYLRWLADQEDFTAARNPGLYEYVMLALGRKDD